jgi:hypothetical protein
MTSTAQWIRIAYPARRMSTASKWLLVIGAALAGCGTKKNPALVCSNGQCTDPKFPFCDVSGAVEGDPNTCIAVSCTPGEFAACDGSNAISCNSAGTNYDVTSCATGCSADTNGCKPCPANTTTCGSNELDVCDANGVLHPQACAAGCVESPTPHCAYLEPRYVPDACDQPASQPSLAITNSGMLDPNLDSNCTGGIVAQTGGPSICVAHYGTIDIASGVTLTIRNTPDPTMGRTIAFVADDALTIEGTLDVGAHGLLSGPGGGFIQSGGVGSTTTGAGGAGGATAGAPGGSTTADGGGSNGGMAATDPALLAALLGGQAATQATGANPFGGGGGGGGITLISCHGQVNVTGMINAGGGGGEGGGQLFNKGFGGGAGGYVVLQGMQISVTGEVYANGGGGGAGAQSGTLAGRAGSDGSLSDSVQAAGGPLASWRRRRWCRRHRDAFARWRQEADDKRAAARRRWR